MKFCGDIIISIVLAQARIFFGVSDMFLINIVLVSVIDKCCCGCESAHALSLWMESVVHCG